MAHKSIEAVVARLEKQNGLSVGHSTCPEEVFVEASPGMEDMDSLEDAVVPRALYEELLRNYQQQQEEMRHLQQELERTRRQLVQQAKKLKEYGALVSEMKELRDLNRRLQDVLLLRLGSGECPAVTCHSTWGHVAQLLLQENKARAREEKLGKMWFSTCPKEKSLPSFMNLAGTLGCSTGHIVVGTLRKAVREQSLTNCFCSLGHPFSKRKYQGIVGSFPKDVSG